MKTNHPLSIPFIFFFSFFVAISLTLAEPGNDRVLIKIGDRKVDPGVLNVMPGTTVLWRNDAGHAVRVRFLSHGVSTTCKEPRGFGGDFYGISESSQISCGEIASLCFLEPNEYRYRIEPDVEGDAAVEGTIRVSSE